MCTPKSTKNMKLLHDTVYAEIFARRKISSISPSALIGEIFIARIFVLC